MIFLAALTLATTMCLHSDDVQRGELPRNELLAPRTAPERNPLLPPSWNADYGYAEYSR
jgi:hypothetical protein